MTNTELEKLRTMLNAKHMELQHGMARRDGIAIERTPDALDEVQILRDDRAALFRIDDGVYGTCLFRES